MMAALRRLGVSWSSLVVVLVTVHVAMSRPGIGPDAMRGLLSVEQRMAGRGNGLTEFLTADPSDLRRDQRHVISWWAPGPQHVVYGLRRLGFSLDASIRVAVTLLWAAGIVAWAVLFQQSMRNARALVWLLAAFALYRVSHASAFQYTGGDTLIWGAFPLVALANLRALRARGSAQLLWAALSGLLAGSLVLLKYSGGILGLGLGLAWIASWTRRDVTTRPVLAWAVGAVSATAVAVFVGIVELMQEGTPATPLWSNPIAVVLAVGVFGPLAAVADASAILAFALRYFAVQPASDAVVVGLMLLLGGCVAAWAIMWARAKEESTPNWLPAHRLALRQAIAVTVTVSVAVIVIQLRGGLISSESRHYQYGAFLLMPFFADALAATIRSSSQRLRLCAAACLIVFFLLPAAFGGALIVVRSTRAVMNSAAGVASGWTADGRPSAVAIRELDTLPGFETALLATASIPTAIAFPSKRVQFVMQSGQWRSERFQGLPPGGVALLLHPGVSPADARLLQAAFDDVRRWTRIPLTSTPEGQLWLGS